MEKSEAFFERSLTKGSKTSITSQWDIQNIIMRPISQRFAAFKSPLSE